MPRICLHKPASILRRSHRTLMANSPARLSARASLRRTKREASKEQPPLPRYTGAAAKLSGRQTSVRASEFFLEGTDVEFLRPRTRVLVREMPVGLGNRVRLEHVFVLDIGEALADEGRVDSAVDIDVGDMDSLRPQVARHHLRQPAHREFGGSKGGRRRERTDSRRRAGKDYRTLARREHRRNDLLRA